MEEKNNLSNSCIYLLTYYILLYYNSLPDSSGMVGGRSDEWRDKYLCYKVQQ